jgi:protein-L-isoaspartate(D-aspartate) O-methyltransferase
VEEPLGEAGLAGAAVASYVVDAVDAAFVAAPRAGFLPRAAAARSSFDGPIPIGHGQTNSQPRTVATMLRLLDVRPGHRVLDVGSGSGWTTALLAHLTGPTGSVLGVELVTELVTMGARNLAACDLGWARIEPADPDVLGRPGQAPFDRILVSAAARSLPEQLVDQLGDGGRLVAPVSGTLLVVERSGDDVAVSEHGHYRFVPLRTGGRRERRL